MIAAGKWRIISLQGCGTHTHTPQTEYVAYSPIDGPKSKHGWTVLIELNGLEAKGKRLGEDRRCEVGRD